MHDFVVYPREALLIGMCVGESECTQHKYFRSTIAERIEAFFGRSETVESTLLDTLDSICDNLDEVQLKSRLEQLCGTQRALFLLGLDFGRLLYDVSEFMSNDQFDAVAGISQVEQLVSRLLVNPLVSANHFASQALQSLPKVLQGQFERIMNRGNTTNRRAVCGKTARTVRREGSLDSIRLPYPDLSLLIDTKTATTERFLQIDA